MDFLTLFAIYVVLVVSCIVLVCKYSGQQQTPLGRIFSALTEIASPWVPQWLQRYFYMTVHLLFHQRNRLFVYLHLFLEGVVYAEFSYEVLGYCREMGTSLASLCVPYVLLVVQSYFFYRCCSLDPGTVTKENLSAQVQVYQYDGNLFHPGLSCPTCLLVKPARSKHCRVCNRCVQRFDHHCVWVNNCVGAQNIRHFLLYLVCLCAMAGNMAVLTGDMLLNVVLASGLLHAHYVDQQGEQQPVGPVFITQHLFLTFPRIVFTLGFLVFLFLVLAGYAAFHLYLVLVNQTSNEWYKRAGHGCQHCHPTAGRPCSADHGQSRRFYSRGLLGNLGEVFWPLTRDGKKHK